MNTEYLGTEAEEYGLHAGGGVLEEQLIRLSTLQDPPLPQHNTIFILQIS
jgi:hypothetical protein